MQADRFLTASLRDLRVARLLAAALQAVEPATLVSRFLRNAALPRFRRLFFLGLGKAAEGMTRAAVSWNSEFTAALVITKRLEARATPSAADRVANDLDPGESRLRLLEAGHPIPDHRSLAAGRAALEFVSRLHADDLLICLISGGGSALATVPTHGVSLAGLRQLTAALLASGASIDEINILRRQLDRVKGGGLATATEARILSLILSDVPGDHLEAIASGPTAPNSSSPQDAIAILEKYRIRPQQSIWEALRRQGSASSITKLGPVDNVIIGNNRTAVLAAGAQAKVEGLSVELLSTEIGGEARLAGRQLAERLAAALKHRPRPFCMIAGGETTVKLTGEGQGGRNQELALSAVDVLAGPEAAMLISMASDGEDGPTDAAGAVVTQHTRGRASRLALSAEEHLSRNDAYHFFEALGDLLRPGYTGTNVNDLIFLMGL